MRLLNFLSLFRDLQKPARFSGGGVVAEFFRDLQEPTRFSGEGVVAEFFSDLREPTWFNGGGVWQDFSVISSCGINFLPNIKLYSWVETHILLKYDKNLHFLRKKNIKSDSLNSGSFLCNSGRPGDHARFLETPGNSGTLGRSAYV